MQKGYKQPDDFDLKLAIDCAASFSDSSGLGCAISDMGGKVLYKVGFSCDSCTVCAAIGARPESCIKAHIYGMTEAERFGGKYIYFCPMGLSFFVSPIVGQAGSAAKITVGPFLMVDTEDYIAYDLQMKQKLDAESISNVLKAMKPVPFVPPGRVQSLSNLLFMAVGFLNDASATNRMLEAQRHEQVNGQISAYILELKKQENPPVYPLETENALVASIVHSDKEKAQQFLNELLGFIFFSTGGEFGHIRTRVFELLVVMSRAAISAGASPERVYSLNYDFITGSDGADSIDSFYTRIGKAMNDMLGSVFRFADIKHIDVIHKTITHVQNCYSQRITLEDMAGKVYLSPSYFSKVFKKEMGCTFGTYLNRVRIEKSKQLVKSNLRLADVAVMVGFEDQSYFTKVFKRVTGTSPNRYRELGGRV